MIFSHYIEKLFRALIYIFRNLVIIFLITESNSVKIHKKRINKKNKQ
jgi:hypothetical protein